MGNAASSPSFVLFIFSWVVSLSVRVFDKTLGNVEVQIQMQWMRLKQPPVPVTCKDRPVLWLTWRPNRDDEHAKTFRPACRIWQGSSASRSSSPHLSRPSAAVAARIPNFIFIFNFNF